MATRKEQCRCIYVPFIQRQNTDQDCCSNSKEMPHKGKPMQETSKQNRIWQKSRETKTGLDFDVRQTPNCQMHRAHVQGHALVAPARPSCRREVCQIGKRAQRMFDRHETHHRLAFCHTPSTKIEPREFLLWHLLNRLLRPCEICCIPITEKILYNQCRNIPIRVKLPWPAVVLDFFLIRGGSAIANFLSCQVSFGESYCYLLWPHIQEGHQSAVTICTAAKTLNPKGVVEMWAPAVKFGSDKVCVCVCASSMGWGRRLRKHKVLAAVSQVRLSCDLRRDWLRGFRRSSAEVCGIGCGLSEWQTQNRLMEYYQEAICNVGPARISVGRCLSGMKSSITSASRWMKSWSAFEERQTLSKCSRRWNSNFESKHANSYCAPRMKTPFDFSFKMNSVKSFMVLSFSSGLSYHEGLSLVVRLFLWLLTLIPKEGELHLRVLLKMHNMMRSHIRWLELATVASATVTAMLWELQVGQLTGWSGSRQTQSSHWWCRTLKLQDRVSGKAE